MKIHSLFPLFLARGVRAAQAMQPKQAAPETPWEELRVVLSSPNILNLPTVSEWEEQCLRPMLFNDTLPDTFTLYGYDIGFQPAGVCMIHMSCMYEKCDYPPFYYPESGFSDENWEYNRALEPPFDTSDLFDDIMELPAAVLHPKSASDIIHGIEFAQKHDIGISVKVVGHSYFGASTNRGTLLIKMSSNYPQYGIEGSLTECSGVITTATDANGVACALATTRGKTAFLRVGGGEIFDTAYRAVFFDWNENPDNVNKYHFVGGFAGTVSAAGGWMHSGGLSGASMRLHGIGIDQVLQIEMVLPNGNHVRFGPSSWEEQEEGYPKTTAVTGYCNANLYETDEFLWEWTACEEDNNFEDLWFAVRGGGGGTFGIVTSLYYQLHELPGNVQIVFVNGTAILDPNGGEKTELIVEEYLRFFLSYLFLPETLHNVTELESRSCNSPGHVTSSATGVFLCHNSAGDKVIDEWKTYLETSHIIEKFGDDDDLMTAMESLFIIIEEHPSQGHATVMKDGPYAGRLGDGLGVTFEVNEIGVGLDHVPLETLKNHFDELISLMLEEVLSGHVTGMYLMGGAVPFSSDQMNALGPLRRKSALAKGSLAPGALGGGNVELYAKYYELFFRDTDYMDNDDAPFPGIFCHNHASNQAIGPLKTNWTQACPSLAEVSQAEREDLCVSQAESFWGTTNVARLESIKKDVDPNNLFICNAGIGSILPETGPDEEIEDLAASANVTESSNVADSATVASASNLKVVAMVSISAFLLFV